ncbi:DEAD/DEAH box helicase [Compostibacter hankyongensis]|uniref:RNA helicase n=1 Tax=Compostibacter hankyongensis TaxID=1007089 RepID=A0ABP8G9S4_9BACT
MQAFEALGLRAELIQAIAERGFQEPTPIQQQAIPCLLAQTQDFVGLAQTGTGKTAAFGLPLLQHLDTDSREVQALVLAPTRELCMQIAADLEVFARYLPKVRAIAVYGGTSIGPQIRQLRQGVQLIIATPGRLIDLIERKAVDLGTVQQVVLDEADEMLNMGFRDDIDYILEKTVSRLSTWLFSATMPEGVRRIAARFMKNPKEVSVGRQNTAAANISHEYYMTSAHDRYEALKRIVDYHPEMYGIIFTRTKADAQEIADKLRREGYGIDALHGDLSQPQRDKVMKDFRDRTLQLLIATDVAARGIDVDSITHVINYALPDDTEVYTHRSGRTARAGRSGTCISLIHMRETGKLREIERLVKARFVRKPVPSGKEVCEKQFFHFIDRIHDADISHGDYEHYLPQLTERFADMSKEELLTRMASLEFNRFLEYYRDAPDLNARTERRTTRDTPYRDRDRGQDRYRPESGKVRLFINVGSKDGFYKASFLQFILDMSDLPKQVLGRIDLKEMNSFVEIDTDAAQQMIRALDGRKMKGRQIRMNLADRSGGPQQGQGGASYGRGPRYRNRP